MKQYYGISVVKAEPATKQTKGNDYIIVPDSKQLTLGEIEMLIGGNTEKGYVVYAPNGKTVWMDKERFESIYREVVPHFGIGDYESDAVVIGGKYLMEENS